MSANEATQTSWIRKTPGVCGGRACVRNCGIPVWLLVQARNMGLSDQEQLARFDPPLAQADLDAAWRYYEEHRAEIDRDIAENEEN